MQNPNIFKEKRPAAAALKASAMPETLKMAPAEARRRLEQGENVTVIDTRGRAAHARSDERIDGDLRVEGTRGLPQVLGRIRQIPQGWILAYCT